MVQNTKGKLILEAKVKLEIEVDIFNHESNMIWSENFLDSNIGMHLDGDVKRTFTQNMSVSTIERDKDQ